MGAAQSSNVVNAISNVTNEIQNETAASATNIVNCVNNYTVTRCRITGPLNAQATCNIGITSNQIAAAIQNNNLNNTIAQTLLQEATSTVGSLGLGYASATNTANAFANSTTAIVNSVSTSVSNNVNQITNFVCRDSELNTANIGTTTDVNFLTNQVLQNEATNRVINNISQDITQRATATVEGLVGFLIALAILIVAIGWVLFRPLQLALSSRIFIIFLIVAVVVGYLILAYFLRIPPFSDPQYCVTVPASIGTCAPGVPCADPQQRDVSLSNPPLRYAFPIIGTGDTSIPGGGTASFTPGLLQMAIARAGGWNAAAFNVFEGLRGTQGNPFNTYNIPNPLLNLNGNYVTNNYPTNDPNTANVWQNFINNRQNAANARFTLAEYLNIDTYMRIDPIEPCTVPPNAQCYQYTPGQSTAGYNFQGAITGQGTISGSFGICQSALYRFNQAVRLWGLIILGVLLLLLFAFILFYKRPGPEVTTTTSTVSV